MKANTRLASCIALAAATLCDGAARADDGTSKMLSFSGFGTAGVVHSDNRNVDFTGSSMFQPNGAGHTRSVSSDVDSKLGVQMNANINEQWSAVLQLVSQQNFDNSYTPHVEWANVTYKATPNFSIRVGRTLWPVLLRSETQNIGYSNPFVRNASELIARMPNTSSDGVDASYRYSFTGISNETTLLAGKSDHDAAGKGAMGQSYLNVADIRGISHTSEMDAWKVHAAYMKMNYTAYFQNYLFTDVPYKSLTLGVNYDPGQWFATADLWKPDDKAFGKATAYTAGVGLRLGNFTPYATYSNLRQDSVGVTGFGQSGNHQSDAAFGVRWDFMSNTCFKLQYDNVKSGMIALLFPGSLANIQPQFLASPKVQAVSATIDFIF